MNSNPTTPEPRIEALSAITLATRDMERAVRFYEALGFPMKYGGANDAFTSFSFGHSFLNLIAETRGPLGWWGRVIVYVSDVDSLYRKARAAGLAPEFEPRDAPWGERYFHIVDPDGHELSFAQPLAGTISPRAKADPGKRMSISTVFEGDPAEVIDRMRRGTPAHVVPLIATRYGLSQDGFIRMLGLPKSTMKSRLAKNGELSSSERDRVYRAEKIWQRALEVFEDEGAVRTWVIQANRSLGGEAPLSLLDTEPGYELVLDTLERIEYGIVA